MSFDPRFDARWHKVIDPAIRSIDSNTIPLEPVRVDQRPIGESILTEILTGISRSTVVFVDITTIGMNNDRPVRNGNVMYELGIAQAVRLPEEVIVFRSDEDPLPFDVASIRVNSYKPDAQPHVAKEMVSSAIRSAIAEVDLKRHLAVRRALEMLDHSMLMVLIEALATAGIVHPRMKTMGEILQLTGRVAAISRLLELGLLQTEYQRYVPTDRDLEDDPQLFGMVKYQCTALGVEVCKEMTTRVMFTPRPNGGEPPSDGASV